MCKGRLWVGQSSGGFFACAQNDSKGKRRDVVGAVPQKSLPCARGGGKTAGFDGGVVTGLGNSQTLQPLSLVITRQLPLHRGAFLLSKHSGSGDGCWNPFDTQLSKTAPTRFEMGVGGARGRALPGFLSCISLQRNTQEKRRMAFPPRQVRS